MGLFQAVARGSAEPAALVSLSWLPPGAARRRPPLVLVGKAVTFDSGGLSLKPSDSMVTMHTDMAGAAAVVAAMRVVAALRRPSRSTPSSAPARTCRAAGPTSPPTW